jgi:toxin YoeB
VERFHTTWSTPSEDRAAVKIVFSDDGWDDYCSWSGDRRILLRINRMIEEAKRNPGEGIGKPERLTANLSGYWSRRIDGEHRLVYKVQVDEIVIVQARYHY